MITLSVDGLEFYGHHGYTDEEQAIGHRYRVDVEVDFFTEAVSSDKLGDTVDYYKMCDVLVALGTSERYRLIEKLAQELAVAVAGMDSRIEAVRLTVGKVNPPIRHQAEFAGVSIEWTR